MAEYPGSLSLGQVEVFFQVMINLESQFIYYLYLSTNRRKFLKP